MPQSYLLTADDILDLPGFVTELRDENNPVSRLLCGILDHNLVCRLQACDVGNPGATLAADLLSGLNQLIGGPGIYDAAAFEYARPTAGTQRLAASGPSGGDLALLDRLLLTEAYPAAIRLVYAHKTPEWYRYHVEKFTAVRPDYELYGEALRAILREVCRSLAPFAIVETRTKSVSSFAEKAWRKGYTNPICQTTDMLGARVIAETQSQVEQVCEYIKSAFLIDAANSIDHRDRLKADQFGYLSIHYIAMPTPTQITDLEARGVIPKASWPALTGRKAEVQVRTMLQHAHATVTHDRVYKAAFTLPETVERDLARAGAMLEQTDAVLRQAVDAVDVYSGSYGAYRDTAKREQEKGTLETALAYEPDEGAKPGVALKLALIEKSVWNWAGVVDALTRYLAAPSQEQPRLRMEYGYAVCRLNQADPYGAAYEEGIGALERAAKALAADSVRFPKRLLVHAQSCLAWAYGNRDNHVNDVQRARDAYHRVYELDRSNPYNLASYLEFEISTGVDRDVLQYMHHTLLAAADTCRLHARARVELPWAYLTMGRLYLLAGEPFPSLAAYCKAIDLCTPRDGRGCYPREILDDERRFLRNIGRRGGREEDRWVLDLLELALCVRHEAIDARKRIETRAKRPGGYLPRVVIVSGGTHPDVEPAMRSYQGCLLAGFEDFSGTLISGGTKAGIPGVVGGIAEELRSRGREVRVRTYLPDNLPADAPRDERYDEVVTGVSDALSPRQSLQAWIDLVAAGIEPRSVKLLGVNGGPLTAFEYKLALALGAQVAVIRESGRAAAELAPDEDWQDSPNLLWLPVNPMTVRAFLTRIHPKKLSRTW